MKITTRLRAKIHVYDSLVTLIDDAITFPGEWLDQTDIGDADLTVSEAALVREVARDLLTEMERRRDRAKAKIKPKQRKPDGHCHNGLQCLAPESCICLCCTGKL
jgi:hypothetical protein